MGSRRDPIDETAAGAAAGALRAGCDDAATRDWIMMIAEDRQIHLAVPPRRGNIGNEPNILSGGRSRATSPSALAVLLVSAIFERKIPL